MSLSTLAGVLWYIIVHYKERTSFWGLRDVPKGDSDIAIGLSVSAAIIPSIRWWDPSNEARIQGDVLEGVLVARSTTHLANWFMVDRRSYTLDVRCEE